VVRIRANAADEISEYGLATKPPLTDACRLPMKHIDIARLFVSAAACLGIVQFTVAVPIAIRCYPAEGGARGSGYSVVDNFLSDLGCSKTPSGQDNSRSAAVFNTSVIALGVTLLPFFSVLSTTIEKLRKLVWFSGTLAALGLIGIGSTPYDRHFVAHNVSLGLWLGPMLLLLIGYFVGSARSGQATSGLAVWTGILVLAILAYAFGASHVEHVLMQKVTVGVSIVWFAIIAVNVAVTTVQVVSTTTRRQIVEWQAEQYMASLQHGHRRKTNADR
jgi:hypothetical membrane protein